MLVCWYSLALGCSFMPARAPDWYYGESPAFSREDYLLGRGSGETRDAAERRAYAALARMFHAEVETTAEDRETYSQTTRDSRSTQTRHITLGHDTVVSSHKVLENVEVLDVWTSDNASVPVAVLLGIHRGKAERVLRDRLQTYDEIVRRGVARARSDAAPLTRAQGYVRAVRALSERADVAKDMQTVRMDGTSPAPMYDGQALRAEYEQLIQRDLVVVVEIGGARAAALEQAVWEGLGREGFAAAARSVRTGRTAETASNTNNAMAQPSDVEILGTGAIRDLDLADPFFTYVRWCANVHVKDAAHGRVIGVISRSGKEGHVTKPTARTRAVQAMQDAVADGVASALRRYLENDSESIASADAPHLSSCSP